MQDIIQFVELFVCPNLQKIFPKRKKVSNLNPEESKANKPKSAVCGNNNRFYSDIDDIVPRSDQSKYFFMKSAIFILPATSAS